MHVSLVQHQCLHTPLFLSLTWAYAGFLGKGTDCQDQKELFLQKNIWKLKATLLWDVGNTKRGERDCHLFSGEPDLQLCPTVPSGSVVVQPWALLSSFGQSWVGDGTGHLIAKQARVPWQRCWMSEAMAAHMPMERWKRKMGIPLAARERGS